jgi:ferric-dicitrate binding protein FerR (iron transport regulator)
MNHKEREIFERYMQGDASIGEQARMEGVFRARGEQAEVKGAVKEKWNAYLQSKELEKKDLTGVLDKVHHVINLQSMRDIPSLTHRIYRYYAAISAIIVLPIVFVGLMTFLKLEKVQGLLAEKTSQITIASPDGARLAFHLPDGSEGVLNGGSTLNYQVPFSHNRQVKLEGEAFFDVKSDAEHPFEVGTEQMNVKVLGTRFNVRSYQQDAFTEVVLEEGKVECLERFHNKRIILLPNERLTLSKDVVERTQIEAKDYVSWKDGKLVFKRSSILEVVERISRFYNVDIEIADDELLAYRFQATFYDDTLMEVLEMLKITSPLEYAIIDRQQQNDGSFTKKKVVLKKRK